MRSPFKHQLVHLHVLRMCLFAASLWGGICDSHNMSSLWLDGQAQLFHWKESVDNACGERTGHIVDIDDCNRIKYTLVASGHGGQSILTNVMATPVWLSTMWGRECETCLPDSVRRFRQQVLELMRMYEAAAANVQAHDIDGEQLPPPTSIHECCFFGQFQDAVSEEMSFPCALCSRSCHTRF